MAGVRRNLLNLFQQANSGRRRDAQALTNALASIASARASERFEPVLGALGAETLRRRRPSAAARKSHVRGMQLLKENLAPVQREQYEHYGYFDVVGGETGRRYRIRNGSQMNVQRLDAKGRPVCLLCFMPDGELVIGDVMLAQKLALELFETETLEVANAFSADYSLLGPMP
jgi:hypothetical protein